MAFNGALQLKWFYDSMPSSRKLTSSSSSLLSLPHSSPSLWRHPLTKTSCGGKERHWRQCKSKPKRSGSCIAVLGWVLESKCALARSRNPGAGSGISSWAFSSKLCKYQRECAERGRGREIYQLQLRKAACCNPGWTESLEAWRLGWELWKAGLRAKHMGLGASGNWMRSISWGASLAPGAASHQGKWCFSLLNSSIWMPDSYCCENAHLICIKQAADKTVWMIPYEKLSISGVSPYPDYLYQAQQHTHIHVSGDPA